MFIRILISIFQVLLWAYFIIISSYGIAEFSAPIFFKGYNTILGGSSEGLRQYKISYQESQNVFSRLAAVANSKGENDKNEIYEKIISENKKAWQEAIGKGFIVGLIINIGCMASLIIIHRRKSIREN